MKKQTTLVWPPTSMEMTWTMFQSFLQVRKASLFLCHFNLSAIFVSRFFLLAKKVLPQLIADVVNIFFFTRSRLFKVRLRLFMISVNIHFSFVTFQWGFLLICIVLQFWIWVISNSRKNQQWKTLFICHLGFRCRVGIEILNYKLGGGGGLSFIYCFPATQPPTLPPFGLGEERLRDELKWRMCRRLAPVGFWAADCWKPWHLRWKQP